MAFARIELTQGLVALVDESIFDESLRCEFRDGTVWEGKLLDLHWYANRSRRTFYAISKWKGQRIRMHRAISRASALVMVDHRDLDGLHNWRENLRIATNSQNQHNAATRSDNTSGFKGVRAAGRKFWAQIKRSGRMAHIGTFATAEEAARAYDAAAIEHFGEFARLNFPLKAVGS